MAMVLTQDNFETEVLNSEKPVLVDFWATWCGPCKMLAPVVEQVSNENPDIKVCKIDIDENPELAKKFQIMSIPTLVAIKDGKEVNRSVGVIPKDDIIKLLK